MRKTGSYFENFQVIEAPKATKKIEHLTDVKGKFISRTLKETHLLGLRA